MCGDKSDTKHDVVQSTISVLQTINISKIRNFEVVYEFSSMLFLTGVIALRNNQGCSLFTLKSFGAGTAVISSQKLDIVGTVYHLVIYMQSNKINTVF